MDIIGKIRKIKASLANDGSQELADNYIELIEEAKDIEVLLRNSAFSKILAKMKEDFKERIDELVKQDAELSAMKRMFIRTVGMKGTEENIIKTIEEYINQTEVK